MKKGNWREGNIEKFTLARIILSSVFFFWKFFFKKLDFITNKVFPSIQTKQIILKNVKDI